MIESPETPAAAPPGREALRRLRAAVDATGRRLGAFPPLAVLGAFALVQWAALAAVALRTVHDGWVYDTGSRPSSGVVSALPAIVVGQTLVLLPLALWLVYAVADRLAGRVFAAWAAAVWVLLPYAGYAFSTGGYRHTYADGFLTHVLGLTADPAFPALWRSSAPATSPSGRSQRRAGLRSPPLRWRARRWGPRSCRVPPSSPSPLQRC